MEREEGELTDEDLEDVSDNSSELSIPIALTGKSPLREPFRELSLTSISDDSDSLLVEKTTYRHISRELYRKHSHKHRRQDPPSTKRARKFSEKRDRRRSSIHRKDYSSVSSSSDDSNYKNKTILRQLRDAVRINRSQNLPNCSLRTRLKRMIEPVSASQTSNSSDDDNLEILRDQALQSKTKIDSDSTKQTTDNNVTDEDLAQLRLNALKSAVIKKHAERRKRKEEQLKLQQQENAAQQEKPQDTQNIKETTNENETLDNNKSIEEDEDILRAMLLTSISKKIADKKTQPLPNKPNSKPNGFVQKPNENNFKLPVNPPINRFIINVNSDSETDSDNDANMPEKKATKPLNPKNDIFDKSLSLFLQQARAKTEQDKTKHQSDISHLPRSQQIEYKRLKRKLQILSARMKPANKMKKLATNTVVPDENKKIVNNLNANVNSNYSKKIVVAQQGLTDKTRKDERLMVKGKYEELAPLMSRVSEARNARDRTQAEVTRLINNLRIARAQLTAHHQEYTVLVQELVQAKTDIDKRAEIQQKKTVNVCTSTPNKLLKENNALVVTNEPIPQQQKIIQEQQEQPQQPQEQPEINDIENTDMMDVDETVPELDIKKEATILKYYSPLEHIQIDRKQPLQNPLLELCPYDLLGVCRDADCSYQHCGGVNNNTNTNANTNTNNTITN